MGGLIMALGSLNSAATLDQAATSSPPPGDGPSSDLPLAMDQAAAHLLLGRRPRSPILWPRRPVSLHCLQALGQNPSRRANACCLSRQGSTLGHSPRRACVRSLNAPRRTPQFAGPDARYYSAGADSFLGIIWPLYK